MVKINFLIFEFGHTSYSVLNYFIHAEAGILNLLLVKKKKEFRVIIKLFFILGAWRDAYA